jgi:hypothetical protein
VCVGKDCTQPPVPSANCTAAVQSFIHSETPAQYVVLPPNEMMHFQKLTKGGSYGAGNWTRRHPSLVASPPTPCLDPHSHLSRRDGNYRGVLPSTSGDFSFPRSELRTAETLRERETSERRFAGWLRSWGGACACTFQIVLSNVQLLECCTLWGRSSETAKTQEWPSNWILSAE